MRLLLLLSTPACAKVTYDTEIPVDDTFERVPATGALLEKIERAASYSEAHKGRAFMVLQGDTVIYETGQNGHALSEPHHLYSGTKSFSCALYEVARQDGLLTADTSLSATFADLPETLTVDHLLHLTSGQTQDIGRLRWDTMMRNRRIDDIYAATLTQPFDHEPGSTFEYGATHFNLFGALITEKLGDPVGVLEERVFDAIDLKTAGWLRDPDGNPTLSAGAWTTVNEWAKYGVLVRDDGMFLGQRVLEPGLHSCLQGSEANPAYGRTFWLNKDVDDTVALIATEQLEKDGPVISNEGPDDLVAAAGFDDQRLYIVPSLDLVIVRLSDGGRGFTDRELLAPFWD